MFSLLRALHVHVAKPGDGLLPELLNMSPWPHGKPMNENSIATAAGSVPDPPPVRQKTQ
jgi:hypothetical protein